MDALGMVGLAAGVFGAIAAGIVVYPTVRGTKPAQVQVALDRFRATQKRLRDEQVILGQRALEEAPARWRIPGLPVLGRADWLFGRPRSLMSIEIAFTPGASTEIKRDEWKVLKGLDLAGPISYSEAICKANPDSPYFNGTVYRPRAVEVLPAGLLIKFEVGKYFDYLDSGEVLAYEAAQGKSELRRRHKEPFDLSSRAISLGILTLTIVRRQGGTVFLMHRRSGAYVVGDALFHIVPAGEFTPSDVSAAAVRNDFNLWRNIMREYAEELLGVEDAQGRGGVRIDYERSEPFRTMDAARFGGSLTVDTFGLVLDPLTLKPELLTVAVFEEALFDGLFGDMVRETTEGLIIRDVPFTEAGVGDYISSNTVRLSARALLQLAWEHRVALGL